MKPDTKWIRSMYALGPEKACESAQTRDMRALCERIEALEAALRSIANNSCCSTCLEAGRVAQRALEGSGP